MHTHTQHQKTHNTLFFLSFPIFPFFKKKITKTSKCIIVLYTVQYVIPIAAEYLYILMKQYLVLMIFSLSFGSGVINPGGAFRFLKKGFQRSPFSDCRVALTRERGSNEYMMKQLSSVAQCYELPCIAFEDGPDWASLLQLSISDYDWIVLTSPRVRIAISSKLIYSVTALSNRLLQFY